VAAVFKFAGTVVKPPSYFKIESYNLTKASRMSSGLMTMELIAKKRKFNFKYEVISGTHLDAIMAIVDNPDNIFFELSYQENGVTKTATVYVGAIPREKFRTGGEWYWRNFEFDLIEQ